jgi:rhodanese-related sulfurtransferase
VLIDVRTPREFSQWHARNAKNIPLNRLQENIDYFKKVKKPILLCCASGVRSSQARYILKSNNITEVYDAGTCKRFAN